MFLMPFVYAFFLVGAFAVLWMLAQWFGEFLANKLLKRLDRSKSDKNQK